MAHSCPECGEACYCNGDVDDALLDDEDAVENCEHCPFFPQESDEDLP